MRSKHKPKSKGLELKEREIQPKHSDLDYTPYFSFDKIHKEYSLENIDDKKQQAAFILHICQESQRKWREIRADSNYKAFGMEIVTPSVAGCLSAIVPPGNTVWAFHYHAYFAFVGYIEGRVFHVIGVDSAKRPCYPPPAHNLFSGPP
jgi:hypothetical protein